jgi:methylmalonyl-CoA mutase
MASDAPLALAGDFAPASAQAWRSAVDRALSRDAAKLSAEERDDLFAKRLVAKTYDGIAIRPLYTRADALPVEAETLPGAPPFWRGTTAFGATLGGWEVRSRVALEGDGTATAARVLEELEGGASAILLETRGREPDVELLDHALKGVYLELAPIVLDAGEDTPGWARTLMDLWQRRGVLDTAARGGFGDDPLGRFARCGDARVLSAALDDATALARTCATRFPGVCALVADGSVIHDAGGSDVEELGGAVAACVAYLRALTASDLGIECALAQIELRLAATADQFLTIAKLRAARRLWDRVAEVCGASAARRGPALHAQISHAMLTRYDPWVNLLRATVAGFAAGVGGACSVTLAPFDLRARHEPSELGRRMARNAQTILIEEAQLGRVIDPGGGSWYLESLTREVAERGWAWFQEIEAAGGLIAALEAGLVQHRVAATRAARARNLAHRRQAITGVSEFPNVAEAIEPPPEVPRGAENPNSAFAPIHYADAFEALRLRADIFARETGGRPRVFLAALGPLAEHTPRATFAKNLFEAGGIEAVEVGTVTACDAAERFRTSAARLACLCTSDERYAEEAEAVARALAAAGATRIYVAGAAETLRASLEAAGVSEFVAKGCDAVEVLARALDAAGVPR